MFTDKKITIYTTHTVYFAFIAKLLCALVFFITVPANALDLITLSPTITAPKTAITLSEADQAWLENKKVITLGVSAENFEPYEIIRGQSLKGIVADYVNLIAKSLDLETKVAIYPNWKAALQGLKRGEVDVLSRGSMTDSYSELSNSIPYTLRKPVIVHRGKELEFSKIKVKVKGNIAFSGNFISATKIVENFEQSIPTAFPSSLEALHAVEYQQQNWFIGDPIVVDYYKDQGELQYIHAYPAQNLEEHGYTFLFRKSEERLQALFNEILRKTPLLQANRIVNYWSATVSVKKPEKFLFTEEEKQWLSGHPEVTVGINSALPPYSFYDDNGEVRGAVIDLLAEISQTIGVNFRIVDFSSLGKLEQGLRSKEVDMTLTLLPNEERAKYLHFTEPYLSNSFSLVTKREAKLYKITDLKGKRVAIQRSNFVADRLTRGDATIQLIKKDSQLDSLVAVANGEADAAVTLLPTANYLIRQYFSHDLKVATSLPDLQADLPFSIQAEQTLLYDVISKVIKQLGPNQINRLMNNWNAVAPAQTGIWQEYISSFRLLSAFAALGSLLFLSVIIYLYVKRKNIQLEAERFKFRSVLLDSIPMAISVRDLHGKFLFCNQIFYSQLKVQPDDVIGKRTFDFIGLPQEQAEEHQHLYFQTLKSGMADQRQFDATINGVQLTFRQWDRPYTDKHGNIAGLISVYADMTANVLLAQQLRDSYDRAVQANEAKSRFLAVMSHEIRTPLNAIIGLLELTLQRIDHGETWEREDLEVAYGSSKSLIELIDDILDLAKIESGNLSLMTQRSNLAEIIHSVCRVFSGVAKQKGLYLRLEENLLSTRDISLDAGRLKQILSNVLSNAIKFTDAGGVEIKVHSKSLNDIAQIEIEISDTGIGISPEDQAQLFQPFTQAAKVTHSRGGTGLGLAICRQLVQMMGGSLELRSVPEAGTVIYISLTAPELEEKPQRAEVPVVRQKTKKQLNVLLVDDHPANRLLLGQQLQFLGHTVKEAEDGAQALTLLHKEKFDLVITDCNMPVMDGYELSRRWRSHEVQTNQSSCWIMGFTANVQAQEHTRCLDAGMDGCLFKPVSLAELEDCIEGLGPRSIDLQSSASAENSDSSQLIDKSSVAGITNGNEKLAAMLLNQLHTSNELDLQQLNEKIEGSQWKDIALLAHRLRGVARLINSRALIDSTQFYEDQLELGVSDKQKRALAIAILETLERLQAALSNELQKTTHSPINQ